MTKEYRSLRRRVRALDGVNLTVERGEVFGLLGANGAGKTTLVKVLLGLTATTGGEVLLRGISPREARARVRVGYLPEGHRFPDYLSGVASLRLFGRLAGVSEAILSTRIPALLDLVGLSERGADRVGRYSKGMTQRLGLAAALIDDPDILFLDEPTDGVDPVGRRHIRDVLLSTRARGTTIFINSHMLSEVERTCDRVAILSGGRVVRQGSVEELTRPTKRFRLRFGDEERDVIGAITVPGVRLCGSNGALEVEVECLEALNALIDSLRVERRLIAELAPVRSALEDVFVEVVRDDRGSVNGAGAAAHLAPSAPPQTGGAR